MAWVGIEPIPKGQGSQVSTFSNQKVPEPRSLVVFSYHMRVTRIVRVDSWHSHKAWSLSFIATDSSFGVGWLDFITLNVLFARGSLGRCCPVSRSGPLCSRIWTPQSPAGTPQSHPSSNCTSTAQRTPWWIVFSWVLEALCSDSKTLPSSA